MSAQTIELIAQTLFQRPRKQYLSLKEVAEETSLSIRSVHRLCKQGRLELRKLGNRSLVSRESLDNLLNRLS